MPLFLPPLYAVVDAQVALRHGWSVPALARACLAGGATLLQVRAKQAGGAELLALSREVVADAHARGASVIVNDRPDVAALAGADGVHLGQEDLDASEVHRAFPGLRAVGLSTHTLAQLASALAKPVAYVAVGPVYGTRTKDTGYAAVGLELVRAARRAAETSSRAPVVAIGGITLDTAGDVLAAGAASVAVISDLLSTGDPEARVRAYLERLAPAR